MSILERLTQQEQRTAAENTPEQLKAFIDKRFKAAKKLRASLKDAKDQLIVGDFFKDDFPKLRQLFVRAHKNLEALDTTLWKYEQEAYTRLKSLKK